MGHHPENRGKSGAGLARCVRSDSNAQRRRRRHQPMVFGPIINMPKFKIIIVLSIAAASLAVMVIHHQSQIKFQEDATLWQQQNEQLGALTAEHWRLANLLSKETNNPALDDHTAELAKLRTEADALKKQTNELGRQLAAEHASRPSRSGPPPESHPPEYWEQLHKMAGSKSTEAVYLGSGFFEYASEHQGQCPSSIDQIMPYLAKENRSLSGTNQFEIVYQGSIHDLDGIPLESIAVIRDQQTWQTPDGKSMRVYGMADGIGQIVGSDDNFQSWEALHVILPPKGRSQ
jgi:hypothetical protein